MTDLEEKMAWDAEQDRIALAVEEEEMAFMEAINDVKESCDKEEIIELYESMVDSLVNALDKVEKGKGTRLLKKLWSCEIGADA